MPGELSVTFFDIGDRFSSGALVLDDLSERLSRPLAQLFLHLVTNTVADRIPHGIHQEICRDSLSRWIVVRRLLPLVIDQIGMTQPAPWFTATVGVIASY
jgi:hypothetical protein